MTSWLSDASLTEQKLIAELLKGSGIELVHPHTVDLVPPLESFHPRNLTELDKLVLGQVDARSWGRMGNWLRRDEVPYEPSYDSSDPEQLVIVRVTTSEDDDVHAQEVMQWFRSLGSLGLPVAVEFIGDKEQIWLQLAVHKDFVHQVLSSLRIHYPNAVFEEAEDCIATTLNQGQIQCFGDYVPHNLCVHPFQNLLGRARLIHDPLALLIAALSEVNDGIAGFQAIFKPAPAAWNERITAICSQQKIDPDLKRAAQEKCASPLFAVVLRAFGSSQKFISHLDGFLAQAGTSEQGFTLFSYDNLLSSEQIGWMLAERNSYRYGMLLNTWELASLVHPPSPTIAAPKLARVVTVRPMPTAVLGEGLCIGDGLEGDHRLEARIPDKLRMRHLYVVGKSGTGKSTLLLNMVLQDIRRGHGVGVLDPHGDLVKDVLPFIPPERRDDVVYLDAADREFPFAFNPLQSNRYTTVVCNDIIVLLRRMFSDSWGNRMEHILRHSLLTLLESKGPKTLYDLDRILVSPVFRESVLATVANPLLLSFWEDEYPKLFRDIGPVKNKLSQFLMDETLRNIISQREGKVDVHEVLADQKILLVNLAQGELSEGTSRLLGALFVSQIQIAAMARATEKVEDRPSFYFYVDEFQNYTVSSFEKILSEARKYGLSLTMANQFTHQLTDSIRQAVFGNIGSIIAFRVGSEDSRLLSRYFAHFDDQDFLNQETGEAKVMAEKAQWDFSLLTATPPVVEAPFDAEGLIGASRERYASSRKAVLEELSSKPKPKSEDEDNTTAVSADNDLSSKVPDDEIVVDVEL